MIDLGLEPTHISVEPGSKSDSIVLTIILEALKDGGKVIWMTRELPDQRRIIDILGNLNDTKLANLIVLEFKENLSGKLEEIKSILDSKNNEDLLIIENWCEKYGLIWVNLNGKPTKPLPKWAAFEDDNYIVVDCDSELWNASAGRHTENFNDVAHLSFIHSGTFGNPNDPLIERYKVEKTDEGFDRTFTYNEIDKIDYLSDKSEVVPKIYNYRFTYPFASELEMNSPDGRVMTIYDCICPESPTTSRIFISLARNYDRDTPEKEIQKWQAAVNDEDRWVVESQLPKLLPLSPKTEKHIAADAWSLEFRDGFVRLGISRDNGI